MKHDVMSEKGNKLKTKIDLDENVWKVPMNEDLVAQALLVYQDNQRKGTAHSKTRSDVRGGGRKPWRQKGTGRARHGSIRSPIWVGGGVAFGPKSYKKFKSIPKKMAKKALMCALSARIEDGSVIVVSEIKPSEKRMTATMAGTLGEIGVAGQKVLIIIPDKIETKENLHKSTRNIEGLVLADVSNFNIFNVLNAEKVLIFKDAIKDIEKRLS